MYQSRTHESRNGIGIPCVIRTRRRRHPLVTGGKGTRAQYFPNGAVKQFTYGNGIVHTLTQSVRQLPDVSKDAFGTNRVFEVDLNFDRNGNLLSSTDLANANRNRTMTYDGLDRLLTATAPGLWGTASYSYDVLDNLRTNTLGAASYTYAYDTNNRLDLITRAGNTSWDYSTDLRGNVLADGRNSYTFTRANRLAGVSGKETYQYDGHGRRTVVWRQDGTGMVPVYGLDGTLRYTADNKKGGGTSHIYLGDDPVADVFWNWTSGVQTTVYTHTDALGSPIATTDAGRTVIDRNEYAPYGLPINSTVDGPGFTGHVMDQATGLIYMQQRYYDQGVGRFLSVDTVTADSGDLRHFNRYAYSYNNPYKFTDPDGRAPQGCGDGTCQKSYLVSRPLDATDKANHNFVVTHAQGPGDPTATVRSFGDQGDDTMGPVDAQTEGFSQGTQETDTKAFQSLSTDAPTATYREIAAPSRKVDSIAASLKPGDEYSIAPKLQGGVNSNSAAGAIAQKADGGSPSVNNGVEQPGAGQPAVDRVDFLEKK